MMCRVCGGEIITSGCSNWKCPTRNCGAPLVTPETSVVYITDPAKDARIAALEAENKRLRRGLEVADEETRGICRERHKVIEWRMEHPESADFPDLSGGDDEALSKWEKTLVARAEAAEAALAAAREENERLRERRFPIQGGPSIPWRMIMPHEAQAKSNHDQTLERLAERGGLSPGEALAVLDNMSWTKSKWRGLEAQGELERRRVTFEDAANRARADDAGRVERVREALDIAAQDCRGYDMTAVELIEKLRAVLAASDGKGDGR